MDVMPTLFMERRLLVGKGCWLKLTALQMRDLIGLARLKRKHQTYEGLLAHRALSEAGGPLHGAKSVRLNSLRLTPLLALFGLRIETKKGWGQYLVGDFHIDRRRYEHQRRATQVHARQTRVPGPDHFDRAA